MHNTDDRLSQIRRQVRREARFYRHLMTYVVVIFGLVILNYLTLRETSGRHYWNWWVVWPALGWGITIASHWARTFLKIGPFASDWQERKVQELMERESNSGNAR